MRGRKSYRLAKVTKYYLLLDKTYLTKVAEASRRIHASIKDARYFVLLIPFIRVANFIKYSYLNQLR